jgi:Tfp pilus assembly protein PilF
VSEREHDFDAQGPGPEALRRAAYERFDRYASVRRWADARRQMEQVVAHDPTDALAYALMGRMLLIEERTDDAESAAREALRFDPLSVEALWVLADVEVERKHLGAAEQHLLAALALAPEHAGLLRDYARLMHTTGHLDKSKKLLERALALDPNDSSSHKLLGIVESERGRMGKASWHGDKALALEPDEVGSHAVRGHVFSASGNPFAARRHLREALRREPGNADLLEAFLTADRHCRVVMLPAYWFGTLLRRIPGGQFVVWGGFIVLMQVLRNSDLPEATVAAIALSYIGFCIYTWFAEPLTTLWVKLFPPR